jgi:hypothetical protein
LVEAPRRRSTTALTALAIAVAGLVGAFVVYTFGWHDRGSRRRQVASGLDGPAFAYRWAPKHAKR